MDWVICIDIELSLEPTDFCARTLNSIAVSFLKCLIDIGSQLYFGSGALLDQLLTEPAQVFKVHQIKVIGSKKPVRIHHQSFCNDKGINLIRFCLTNVVSAHCRSLDRVNDTYLVVMRDKKFNKVVAVVSRRFKTYKEAVLVKER